jgi:transcriptional regulator with XRE-family HTH domain
MSVMTNPTASDLAKAGYAAVLGGELSRLRTKLGMSRNAQAVLMGVEGESLRRWESAERGMNIGTAIRIGEWLWGAKRAMESLNPDAYLELVPVSSVARQYGIAEKDLEAECDRGEHRHERLGVLGLFIYRSA